jgi:hypothetical protein
MNTSHFGFEIDGIFLGKNWIMKTVNNPNFFAGSGSITKRDLVGQVAYFPNE